MSQHCAACPSSPPLPEAVSLPEVRIDPLTGNKTIIAGERSRRPGGEPRCTPAEPIDPSATRSRRATRTAPHPSSTRCDPAVDRPTRRAGRCGSYPTSTPRSPPRARADTHAGGTPAIPTQSGPVSPPELFIAIPATGAHEVIVNGPQSVLSLADLAARAGHRRGRRLARAHARPRASACVQLIVNERREAGASLPHTHAQLYALDFVPADVARERERSGAHATRTMGHDLLEDIVAEEVRRRERIVAIDDDAVLLAPYASRVPFQLMLAPRRPRARFEDDGPTGAALLHDGLGRLARHLGASPPLNLWVRTAPRGAEHFCWRIDVLPRLTHLAGLELSTGVNLNIVAPEDAAAALRGRERTLGCATMAARRLLRPALRRRTAPGWPALRPLGRAPGPGAARRLPGAEDAQEDLGGARRDRLVPRSQLARAHLRARDRRSPLAVTSYSATSASSPPARTGGAGRAHRARRLHRPDRRRRTPGGRSTSATRSSAAGAVTASDVAAMTLVWGRPLVSGGRAVDRRALRLAVDRCQLIENRFTLLAPDDYREHLLEIKLWSPRGKELARESLYEGEADAQEREPRERPRRVAPRTADRSSADVPASAS